MQFEQSAVEKVPSFSKLVSPFRKPIIQPFLVRFVSTRTSASGEEFLGCMVVVEILGV